MRKHAPADEIVGEYSPKALTRASVTPSLCGKNDGFVVRDDGPIACRHCKSILKDRKAKA